MSDHELWTISYGRQAGILSSLRICEPYTEVAAVRFSPRVANPSLREPMLQGIITERLSSLPKDVQVVVRRIIKQRRETCQSHTWNLVRIDNRTIVKATLCGGSQEECQVVLMGKRAEE
jgi:hypothetical protein